MAAVKNYETGARFFQKQNYEKAEEIFEKLVNGPVREVADRARVHLRLCEQKLSRQTLVPKSGEDFYTLGVAALNSRNLDLVIAHLARANRMEHDQEHIRYSLAAAYALQGNTNAALAHLAAAIALRPANRIQARKDEDFTSLAADPRFGHLVSPEVSKTS